MKRAAFKGQQQQQQKQASKPFHPIVFDEEGSDSF